LETAYISRKQIKSTDFWIEDGKDDIIAMRISIQGHGKARPWRATHVIHQPTSCEFFNWPGEEALCVKIQEDFQTLYRETVTNG
jgi:hypothetical protein